MSISVICTIKYKIAKQKKIIYFSRNFKIKKKIILIFFYKNFISGIRTISFDSFNVLFKTRKIVVVMIFDRFNERKPFKCYNCNATSLSQKAF